MTDPNYNLKQLRAAVDSILVDMGHATLRCATAMRREHDDGDVSYEVIVDEVSPYDDELRAHVHEELERMGFQGVEVRTEW